MKFILFFLLILSIYSKNDYYLVSGGFTDELKSHYFGELQYSGYFYPEDYPEINFQNSSSLTPINSLNISIDLECDSIIHIKITDSDNIRWENPYSISEEYKNKVSKCENTKSLSDVGFQINTNDQLFYNYTDISNNNNEILTNENTNFLFSDYFIAFGNIITSDDVYGFGERMHSFKLGKGLYTMWPNDTSGIQNDTGLGGYNSYGIHPVGIYKIKKNDEKEDNRFIGIILNNINAQDVYINNTDEENKYLLEHRTIGGIIDFYLTLPSNSPDVILKNIQEIIGRPMLPPFFSLGYHQCKWGYIDTNAIRTVYNNFKSLDLPIDTFWTDLDIMDNFKIFSLSEKFKDFPLLIKDLHKDHYHYIPIVDIGVKKDENDIFYNYGHEHNAYLISNYTKQEFVSTCWPGSVVIPDFFSEDGKELWEIGLYNFSELVFYDGIWLDMNEPAQLLTSSDGRAEVLPDNYTFDPQYNIYEYIPYIPGYNQFHTNIRSHSMSENALSHITEKNPLYISYNYKPLLSMKEQIITKNFLISNFSIRPFILSRSTSLGAGKNTFHWLGDNNSEFKYMKNGLNGIFSFNIFGIPMTGDDICGFSGSAWDNLCARWLALGSFFPFSRNHRTLMTPVSQEPYAWGINSYTYKLGKMALKLRYSLLRYFYSELFLISLGEFGSFFKPVFFEYPNDIKTYENISDFAMIGRKLLLYPIFQNETNDIEAYFPNDDWNYLNGSKLLIKKNDTNEGTYLNISGQFNIIHLYIRGGNIIPFQDSTHVKNTYDLHNIGTYLIINPDSNIHRAVGEVIYDFDDFDTIENLNFNRINMEFIYDTILFSSVNKTKDFYNKNDFYIEGIKLYNANYLTEKGNYDILNIILNNDMIKNAKINKINDEIYEVNLKNYKINFNQVKTIKFVQSNEQTNYITK